MKLKILVCLLIGVLSPASSVLGQESSEVDWEIFGTGTPEQVNAEIAKLPEELGLEARTEYGMTPLMLAASSNSIPHSHPIPNWMCEKGGI